MYYRTERSNDAFFYPQLCSVDHNATALAKSGRIVPDCGHRRESQWSKTNVERTERTETKRCVGHALRHSGRQSGLHPPHRANRH